MERKTFPAEMMTVDEPQGIVETVFAVFGNVDLGQDKLHPGSFSKTFQERGTKVRVLDQHRTDSVMRVVGKPLSLRELSRNELPVALLDKYPEATGGAYAQVKLLLNTPEGQGVFERLKEGLVDEWSFGYDPITVDYSTEKDANGKEHTIRNLREVRLMELSPVVWGMNPATQTISAKDIEPEEAKPWKVFEREGKFCVYKVNEDGEAIGDTLGCHDTRDEALAQQRALYANEPDAEMAGEGASEEKEGITPEDRKDILERLERIEALLMERDHDAPAEPERAAEDTPQDEDAGPVIPPTSERLAVLRQLEAELLEVE